MRREFNDHYLHQAFITENQLGTMRIVPCGKKGATENPITIGEDEGISEPRTPTSKLPSEPPVTEAKTLLRSIQKFQNSAARQFFDF